MDNLNKVIFIVGPTATGKTSLAAAVCKEFDGEIISADSRQVYVGMDIGTGKEGESRHSQTENSVMSDRVCFIKSRAKHIDNIPQYLIDIVAPGGEMDNLKNFIDDANLMLDDIWHRGKLPVVVGGTGLYVAALTEGYRLSSEKKGKGEWTARQKPNFQKIVVSTDLPRQTIYERIDKRLKERIAQGLMSEVESLINRGVGTEWLTKVGLEYRFVTARLTGDITSDDDLYDKLRFAIHAYARRQLTWLRHKVSDVEWVSEPRQAMLKINFFLEQGRG